MALLVDLSGAAAEVTGGDASYEGYSKISGKLLLNEMFN